MSAALLWLEGPMQSWGFDSRFQRRATLNFPTRSGILGLLCCAAGLGGEQREWLEKWLPCGQTVLAFARKDARPVPQLRDFHMVGSGYDVSDPWQDMLVPKTIEGKRPSMGSGAKLTYRFYLQDMAFACALELPPGEEVLVAESLMRPVWDIRLGRKCCVPSELVWQGEFSGQDAAIERAFAIAEGKGRREVFRVVDGVLEEGESMTLMDVPISFGPYKRYRDRQVTVIEARQGACDAPVARG